MKKEGLLRKETEIQPFERVGIDVDNTSFNLSDPVLRFINERYGTSFTTDDIRSYWYFLDLLGQLGVSKEEIDIQRTKAFRQDNDPDRVYRDSTPFPGMVEALSKMKGLVDVFVLTSRPPGLRKVIEEQFHDVGIDWLKGDWADGGNILIRDEEYWKKMDGNEFKLHAIRGDFPYGKYKSKKFPGLSCHIDDDASLFKNPLIKGYEDRVFMASWDFNCRLMAGVPEENQIRNWGEYCKVVHCGIRGERFDPTKR